MVKKIGITGGIGSGKSYICSYLIEMGFPVYNSDIEAKNIMVKNSKVVQQIKAIFGTQAYQNGELNRAYLAEKVFTSPHLKERLNNIVHPAVREGFKHWVSQQKSDLVFNEAAILFETGRYKDFDAIILVTAPKDIRIKRVMKRDGVSEQQVIERMNNQWTDERKKERADFVIVNDGKTDVEKEISRLVEQIK